MAECRRNGRCVLSYGECVAAHDDHCRASEMCYKRGMCEVVEGECVATMTEHCRRSVGCAEGANCFLEEGRCTSRREDPAMFAGGIVCISVGGAAILGGAITMLLESLSGILGTIDDDVILAGAATIGTGAALALLAGVPLTVIGSQKKRPRWESVQLRVGPTGGSLAVHF